MKHELIKSQIKTNIESDDILDNNFSTHKPYNRVDCNNNYQDINGFEERESEYFNIKVRNKSYPSCYQYNVLIMLAKRLIKEEEERQEKINACDRKNTLYKKLAFRIIEE